MVDIIKQVEKSMTERNIIPKRSVLIALSGGADSIALLNIINAISKKYGFTVYAAHINHCLRGDAADADEKLSCQAANRLGIECFTLRVDIRAKSQEHGISEELCGRLERYKFFDSLMDDYGIECVATAHHKNDNAETVIMNFLRGSSLGGLCGIPAKRDRIIRPLLDITRCDIEKYCEENGLCYAVDSTNSDIVYTRNRVRNKLIPDIERDFNPNIVETVTKNAQIITDDNNFIDSVAQTEFERMYSDNSVGINELLKLHSSVIRRIIRKMIESVADISDIPMSVIESIYDNAKKGTTGLWTDISADVAARVEYNRLIIAEKTADCPDFEYEIKIGETVFIKETGYSVMVDKADSIENDGAEYFSCPDGIVSIKVTNRRSGDVFLPKGMNGTKKVKEYMINEKIPKGERSRIGIVRFGNDIAWIIGKRRDKRFAFRENGIKIRIIY